MARRRGFISLPLAALHFSEILSFALLAGQCVVWITVAACIPSSLAQLPFYVCGIFFSFAVQRYTASGFRRRASATHSVQDDAPPLCIVTGANTGIGYETALGLARQGFCVVLACRSLTRGEVALNRITDAVPKARVALARLDLESIRSIKDFVSGLPGVVSSISSQPTTSASFSVDILVNNAGFYTPCHEITRDGIERVLAVNHVGPYLLTELLIPALKRSRRPCRIINLSSVAHLTAAPLHACERPYSLQRALERSTTVPGRYYGLSKLCNIMHAQYLANQHHICAVSVNPGGVLTEVFRNVPFTEKILFVLGRWVLKSPDEGAQTTLHCCLGPLSPDSATEPNGSNFIVSGGFYADCRLRDDCRHPCTIDAAEIDGFLCWTRTTVSTLLSTVVSEKAYATVT